MRASILSRKGSFSCEGAFGHKDRSFSEPVIRALAEIGSVLEEGISPPKWLRQQNRLAKLYNTVLDRIMNHLGDGMHTQLLANIFAMDLRSLGADI